MTDEKKIQRHALRVPYTKATEDGRPVFECLACRVELLSNVCHHCAAELRQVFEHDDSPPELDREAPPEADDDDDDTPVEPVNAPDRHGTLYAVAHVNDQTIGYVDDEGCSTTEHPKAKLWDNAHDAARKAIELSVKQTIFLKNGGLPEHPREWSDEKIESMAGYYWIEPVYDEAEFRAREDTW